MTDRAERPQFQAMGLPPTAAARLAAQPSQQFDFTSVFDTHFDYVWFTLRRLGVPPRDLDDVAHDVFLLVYQNLHKYDAARPLRPWLFGFAYRVAADYRRLARHRVETLDAITEAVDVAPSAVDRAASRQALDVVWTALEQLHLDQRAVFVLHDVEEYSVPEIADALQIPLNTAYSRLRLAREQFTKAMLRLRARRSEP